ncbi:MAG TPA: NRDE family protein [Bacteroidia bacterium]
MCILTFTDNENSKIITFTRDEDPNRPFENMKVHSNGLICPMDLKNNGTWIGFNGQQISMLQNGALEKHKRKDHYDRSRGLILMDVLKGKKIEQVFLDLKGLEIEPFSLSNYDVSNNLFTIYAYDGENCVKTIHNDLNKIINLSSTLYDNDNKIRIRKAYLELNAYSPNDLIEFHLKYKINQTEGIFHPLVSSTSVTQFVVSRSEIQYKFINLLTDQIVEGRTELR